MDFNASPTLLPQLFPLKDRKLRFETLQLHGGTPHKDPTTNSKAIPIYQTSSYVYDADAQPGGDAPFNLSSGVKGKSNIYGRLGNPTVDAFERRVCALEGGIAAVACSSGQAAQFMALTCIANSGDNIVSTCQIYGGTHNQLKYLLTRFGITTKFADGDEASQIEAMIDSETKAIFCEMIGNPQSNVPNIPALAEVARRYGVPLIIDNTFGACGYIARPLEMGADIVVESASKWICGHGTTMGGIIVDSGRFDWGRSGKFKTFTSPIEANGGWMGNNLSGHSFWNAFKEHAFTTKLRYELLRDMGACLEPMSAWLLLQGLETLSLRMERHQQNAMAVARFLEKHPKVAWVSYLGLPSHPHHETAKTFIKGFGCTLAFGVKGGRGVDVIKALRLHSAVPNAGSVHSLAIHPASMTHAGWTEENRLAAGISQDLIRLSVGTEHIDDIIEDLSTAMEQVTIDATSTSTMVKPEHAVGHSNLRLSVDFVETSTHKIGRVGVSSPAMA